MQLLVLVLALLIGNTAAGLAGGLAGSLAFAAATLILAQNAGFDGLDMLHGFTLQLGFLSFTVYHRNETVSILFFSLFPAPPQSCVGRRIVVSFPKELPACTIRR